MKPYLLVLLLAIPALISSILSAENSVSSAPAASSTKSASAPTLATDSSAANAKLPAPVPHVPAPGGGAIHAQPCAR